MFCLTITDDFDYNLRFLILDAPGPAGITVSGPRGESVSVSEYEYDTYEEQQYSSRVRVRAIFLQ